MVKFVPRREKIFLQSERAFLASTPGPTYMETGTHFIVSVLLTKLSETLRSVEMS